MEQQSGHVAPSQHSVHINRVKHLKANAPFLSNTSREYSPDRATSRGISPKSSDINAQ